MKTFRKSAAGLMVCAVTMAAAPVAAETYIVAVGAASGRVLVCMVRHQ